MSLGFSYEYDSSKYTEQDFVLMWPELCSIGIDIMASIQLSMPKGAVFRKGDSNETISYVKGCMFMLGYSAVDFGEQQERYDDYLSDAIGRFRKLANQYILSMSLQDCIDTSLIKALEKLFEFREESKIRAIYRLLKKSRLGPIRYRQETEDAEPKRVSTTPNVGVPTAGDLFTKGAPLQTARRAKQDGVPAPESNDKSGLVFGENYPDKNLEWLSKSILYDLRKDGEKQIGKYFKVKDFRSKDGSNVILINPELVKVLDSIRDHFGKPVTITSGYRTPKHNRRLFIESKKKNGKSLVAKQSHHMYGNAADIQVSGVSPSQVRNWLAGFHKGGLIKYSSWVHVDVRNTVGLPKYPRD